MLLLDNYFDELKIRIWYKGEKKLMYFNNPTLIDGDSLEGGLIFRNYDHKIQNVKECNPNDFIIMFFSGLYDKNKKPIYEGDILKDKNGHIRICVKEDGAYKFPALKESRYFHNPIKNKRPDRNNGILAFLTFQDNLSRKDKAQLEIIGDIYKNNEVIRAWKRKNIRI